MAVKHFGRLIFKMAERLSRTRPFNVVVEGNIGSGKTTFLEHFKKYDNVCVMSEPVELWRNCNGYNLLDLMYQDFNKWSFSYQSYVLLTMTEILKAPTPAPIKLMERSIYSARYCFVEKMMREGLIPEPSAAVFNEWFKWVVENAGTHVDLIVYLRATPEVSFERLQRRNRSEEVNVKLEYLQSLHEMLEDWLVHKTLGHCPAPVITINANLDRSIINQEYEKYEDQILQRLAVRG